MAQLYDSSRLSLSPLVLSDESMQNRAAQTNFLAFPNDKQRFASKEMARGAVIEKGGKVFCTPGSEMRNGVCVPISNNDVACLPGWKKSNGICVKQGKEFLAGEEEDGVTVQQRSAAEIRETGFGVNEQRVYLQEAATSSRFESHTSLTTFFLVIALIMFVAPVILYALVRSYRQTLTKK